MQIHQHVIQSFIFLNCTLCILLALHCCLGRKYEIRVQLINPTIVFFYLFVFAAHQLKCDFLIFPCSPSLRVPKYLIENLLFLHIKFGPNAVDKIVKRKHSSCVHMYSILSPQLTSFALRYDFLFVSGK